MTSDVIEVLHVDDEPDFADLAATYLERQDDRFVVETATSVSDGLAAVETGDFECVVSDYDMPGQSGIEFLEAVRAENSDLPFILYTGKGSEEIAGKAISAGVTDYLQKELGADQYAILANRIENAVSAYRSGRELAERNEELRIYERIFKTMQEGAALYDRAGRFAIVNKFVADFYGKTQDELEGSQSQLIDQIRAEGDGDRYQELLDGERSRLRGEVEAEFEDHGHAVLEYRFTPLRIDGTVDGVVGVVRVVTEQKERERELHRSNAVLETVLEHHTAGVLVETADRDVLLANDTLCEVLRVEMDADELTGRDCAAAAEDVKHVFARPEAFIDSIETHLENREPVSGEELKMADGRFVERDYVPYSLPQGDGNLWIYR